MSTAYTNCIIYNKNITEEFYPAAYDYKKLQELTETNSDEALAKMTNDFIRPWPNTYAFTKHIAEDAIQREAQGLPIAVFRPAISKNKNFFCCVCILICPHKVSTKAMISPFNNSFHE